MSGQLCDLLLSLQLDSSYPSRVVCEHIDAIVRPAPRPPRRGCRAGSHKHRVAQYTDCAAGQIPVIYGTRPLAAAAACDPTQGRQCFSVDVNINNLVRVRTLRHAAPTRHYLKYGLMNVHSANDKIDNILSLRRERDLDVLLLCETWHDSDSVCIRRLHADGMRVIEHARPRVINNMSSDHITAESLLRSQITLVYNW